MFCKSKFSTIFWCLYFIDCTQASHYVNQALNSIQLLEGQSQNIDARSPTECILKCQNQFQKKGFYAVDNSCFCTNVTASHASGQIESESGLDGYLYSKREANKVDMTNMKTFKSCHNVYLFGNTENGLYNIEEEDGEKTTTTTECIFDKRNCQDWKDAGHTTAGACEIFIPEIGHKRVRCGMNSWIYVQKRFNGSVDFHRTWTEYKNGFGDASGEYWLGNEALHQLTKSGGPYEWIFKATAFDGTVQVSRYDDFSIGNESTNYLLSVGALTHGSMASLTNKSPFTTYDNDNDLALSFNCAFRGNSGNYKNGGFWYEKCGGFQPNAQYSNNVGGVYQKFIFWKNFRGKSESLKATSMRFRKKP